MYNVRKIEENINMGGNFQGCFLYDQALAERTSFQVGGAAPVVVEPGTEESFLIAMQAIRNLGLPYLVLGGGTNVVAPDEGVEYPVLATSRLHSMALSPDGRSLRCGSGCTWKQIVDFCIEHRLGGLENFAGLPGTVGGAVFMNARCYDKSVSDVVQLVEYGKIAAGKDGQPVVSLETYKINPSHWDYKVSPFQNELAGCPVLSAALAVNPLNEAETMEMKVKAEGFVSDREQKGHFSYPSAGSVFKNNRSFGMPSGQIVDEAGFRGLEVGGAQVAPWHGNFIINRGNATAGDIRSLVQQVQEKVLEKTGVLLEPEIIFLAQSINAP